MCPCLYLRWSHEPWRQKAMTLATKVSIAQPTGALDLGQSSGLSLVADRAHCRNECRSGDVLLTQQLGDLGDSDAAVALVGT